MASRSAHALAALALGAIGSIVPIGSQAVARAHGADADAPIATNPDPRTAGDYIPDVPKAFEGLGLDEKTGAKLPLDTPFRDQDGHDVVLGDLFHDDRPAILTFNYSDCPMLCSVQLNALTTALLQMDYQPGHEFKIITIDLEPRESAARAKEMRQRYLDRLPAERRADAARGWTFLTSRSPLDDSNIKRVADAVGFHYKYIPERAEYAHPAALIFVSSRGMVSRYVGGTDYAADVVRTSIVLAGLSETATSTGFILNCFHYVPGGHPHVAVVAMRVGAVAFIVLFFSALGVWRLLRRARSSHPGVVRS